MSRLGVGAGPPWENRSARVQAVASHCPRDSFSGRVVAGYLNQTYSVQRAIHPEHPGVDHLIIRRHDSKDVTASWSEVQRIKNQLAPFGALRYAFEVYPPLLREVSKHPLRHLFVMPLHWEPPLGIHPDEQGWVPT